jgi:hypothetical protein
MTFTWYMIPIVVLGIGLVLAPWLGKLWADRDPNIVYVVVWPAGGTEFRQNRWTWRRARAERWASRLRQKGLGARVEETTLFFPRRKS